MIFPLKNLRQYHVRFEIRESSIGISCNENLADSGTGIVFDSKTLNETTHIDDYVMLNIIFCSIHRFCISTFIVSGYVYQYLCNFRCVHYTIYRTSGNDSLEVFFKKIEN